MPIKLRNSKNYPILTDKLAEATMGRSVLYSAAFRENAFPYHMNGRNWPHEKLEKFFSDGLLQFYVGISTGYDFGFRNPTNDTHDRTQAPFVTNGISDRDIFNSFFEIDPSLDVQSKLETIANLFDILKEQKFLLFLGGEFQKLKQELENRGYNPMSDDEQRQRLEKDAKLELIQTGIYWWIVDFSNQVREFISSGQSNSQLFSPTVPDFLLDLISSNQVLEKKYIDMFGLLSSRESTLVEVHQSGLSLKYATPDFKKDKEIVLAAVKQNGLALQYAAPDFKNDNEIALEAVKQNGLVLQYAAPDFKKDKEIVLAAVRQNGLALQYAAPDFKNDKEIVLAAVRQNGLALQYAAPDFKNDKKIALAAIQQNSRALQYAQDFKEDREVALAAIMHTSKTDLRDTLKNMSNDLLMNDKHVALAVASRDVSILLNLKSKFLKNREFMLKVVSENGSALKYADKDLKKDKEVVLAAVSNNGSALQYANETLKKDKEVVLAAVSNKGSALKYAEPVIQAEVRLERNLYNDIDRYVNPIHAARETTLSTSESNSLLGNREVVLAAVHQDGSALQYAAKSLRNDRDFVLAAVHLNGSALSYAARELRNDNELVLAAAMQRELKTESTSVKAGEPDLKAVSMPKKNEGFFAIIATAVTTAFKKFTEALGKFISSFKKPYKSVVKETTNLSSDESKQLNSMEQKTSINAAKIQNELSIKPSPTVIIITSNIQNTHQEMPNTSQANINQASNDDPSELKKSGPK